MRPGARARSRVRGSFRSLLWLAPFLISAIWSGAQNLPQERTFPQSKAVVEKLLKTLQPFDAGRLPTLEGFVVPGSLPLDRFQRGYYQCTVEVSSSGSAGSFVRVTAKITAWYADPTSSRSGYRVLPSNGRLEADLLDRLSDALGGDASAAATHPHPTSAPSPNQSRTPEPTLSAPMPRLPTSSLHGGLAAPTPATDASTSLKAQTDAAEKHEQDLAAEAKGLEEILQNQSHPNNLVAVKKTGTPVVAGAGADAQVLFAATAGDEFEILDVTADWVHVRISGLSRGWIRRSSLEMPSDSARNTPASNETQPASSVAFRVASEQFAPFPGDWEALRGKTVKIVSVQKTDENAKDAGPRAKLEFAKAIFNKEYAAVSATADGIVLIFDSEDGGMVAAPLSSLQQWKDGTLSDEAFWRQCFFDPPEILGSHSGG